MSNMPRWRIVLWCADQRPTYWSHLLQFEGFSLHFKFDGTIKVLSVDDRDAAFGTDHESWQVFYEMEDHGGRYLRSPDRMGR